MATYPKPFEHLLANLRKLPGIGEHSAERLAFFLIKESESYAQELSGAITSAKSKLTKCKLCFTVSEKELCPICEDEKRDHHKICVVETPRDLNAIETAGVWPGVYHCLLGRLAPSENIREGDLTIAALVTRIKRDGIEEVMIATNPDLAGDATAMAVARALGACDVAVTRPARGVPMGHSLGALSGAVLQEAFGARAPLPKKSGA